MANGYIRIGLDNTDEQSGDGIYYQLKRPSLTKENYNNDLGQITFVPKTILVDIGTWKDAVGNAVIINEPLQSIGIDTSDNKLIFPSGSVLDSYNVYFSPIAGDLNTWVIQFVHK